MSGENPVQIVKDILRNIPTGNETIFDLAKEVGADGKDTAVLKVIQRRVNPEPPAEPVKEPSPKRAHVFHDAAAMVAYLTKYKTDDTVILADAVCEEVEAVIDEKAPRGFEIVLFKPQKHPLFKPWLEMLGKWMDLRKAIDFLLDNRRSISEPDGKLLARDLSQIKVCKNVTRMQGLGTKSINGIMLETSIEGAKGETRLELPEEITIDVPMYVGCQPISLTMDVTIDHSEEHGVIFRMSSPDIAAKASSQFEQFVKTISVGLQDKCVVGLGSVQHSSWVVLEEPEVD